MPSAQDGNACTLVSPTAPQAAQDADDADPGQIEQVQQAQKQSQTGKYGQIQVKPHNKNNPDNKEKKGWIEVVLVDENDKPVPGQPVTVTMPDDSVASGTTSEQGLFRVDGIDQGCQCKISFPNLDKDAWEPA